MAAVLLQKKHHEEAIDTALRAIELDRNQPESKLSYWSYQLRDALRERFTRARWRA